MNYYNKTGPKKPCRVPLQRVSSRLPLMLTAAMLLFPIMSIESQEQPPAGIKLLIADFADNTGDPDLAVQIKPILHLTLQNSDRLAVYPEIKARRFLKENFQESDSGLTLPRARQLCLSENIPVILLPGINRLGESLIISARLVHLQENRELFVDTIRVNDLNHLAITVEILSKRIRQSLGESRESPSMAGNIFSTDTTFKTLVLFSRSLSFYSYKSRRDAIECLKNILEQDPDMTVAQLRLGNIYLRMQKSRDALTHISKAKASSADLPLKYRYLVDGLDDFLTYRYAEAANRFRSYTDAFPYDWQASFLLGQCELVLGNYPLAVEEHQKAIALDDTRIEPRIGLGLALLYNRDPLGARRILEEAVRLSPDDPEINITRGLLELVENNPRYAIQAFERSGQLPDYRSRSMMLLAQTYIYGGKFKEALEILATGIEEDRRNQDAVAEFSKRLARAQIFRLMGNIPEAVAECLGIPDAGNHPVILAEQGSILAGTGRLDAARKLLLHLGSIPSSPFIEALAGCLQGEIYSAEDQLKEAEQYFLRAQKTLAVPSASLAHVLMKMQQWKRADAEFTEICNRKAAMLFPYHKPWFAGTWVQALYDAGQCSLKMNNIEEAKQYFRQYLWVMEYADPSFETPHKAEMFLTGQSP